MVARIGHTGKTYVRSGQYQITEIVKELRYSDHDGGLRFGVSVVIWYLKMVDVEDGRELWSIRRTSWFRDESAFHPGLYRKKYVIEKAWQELQAHLLGDKPWS